MDPVHGQTAFRSRLVLALAMLVLLGDDPAVVGIKTGTTARAGGCLVLARRSPKPASTT